VSHAHAEWIPGLADVVARWLSPSLLSTARNRPAVAARMSKVLRFMKGSPEEKQVQGAGRVIGEA
jgi:hypothetical protein